jgi:hypothetical protein
MEKEVRAEESEQEIATAYEELKKAAYHAELACESLSRASDGHFERWEQVRDLVFSLRDERDALRVLGGDRVSREA